MIEWYKTREDRYEGYDDGTLVLAVVKEDTWVWEDVPGLWGVEGYNTLEEAKTAAQEWYEDNHKEISSEWPEFDVDLEMEDNWDDWEDEWKNFCGNLDIE